MSPMACMGPRIILSVFEEILGENSPVSTAKVSAEGVFGYGDPAIRGLGAYDLSNGVVGISSSGSGVSGTSTSGLGVSAVTSSTNLPALAAVSLANTNASAGLFIGDVSIIGALTVFDSPKSSAVLHPDGCHRLFYCLESTESWFEDFGEGTLVRGRARIKLNRDFALLMRTDKYHVFLTPYGNSEGLYVANRTRTGFEVREQRNGKSHAKFSYRIVAKRKDIRGQRLAKVKLPKIAHTGTRLQPLTVTRLRKSAKIFGYAPVRRPKLGIPRRSIRIPSRPATKFL